MLNGIAIIKVCYFNNAIKDSIKSLKAARFTSRDGITIESMGNIVSWSKGQIIQMITDISEKEKVFTATVEDEKYSLGSEIEAYPNNEPKYLRLNKSSKEQDDLGDVPTYQAHC